MKQHGTERLAITEQAEFIRQMQRESWVGSINTSSRGLKGKKKALNRTESVV